MDFEWDEQKAKTNKAKHKVDFEEAVSIFADPRSVTFFDPAYSEDEDRFITIGMSSRSRVLLVVHTDRDDRTRLISARKATARERKAYEEEK
jgi:uncharacterized DUF497 family protein